MRDIDIIEVKRIFAKRNAIITGEHFVYAKKPDGWYHGYEYVNKDAIYPFVSDVKRLCQIVAMHFLMHKIDVVVGPTVGGVILSQRIAEYLLGMNSSINTDVLSVFADEIGGKRVIKRGYDAYVKGKRCLICEDVINSGKTVTATIEAVNDCGGKVVAVVALCNRSGGKVDRSTFMVGELVSLIDLNMQMFKEEECPICKERGVESVRTDLGKGKEFLERIRAK